MKIDHADSVSWTEMRKGWKGCGMKEIWFVVVTDCIVDNTDEN